MRLSMVMQERGGDFGHVLVEYAYKRVGRWLAKLGLYTLW